MSTVPMRSLTAPNDVGIAVQTPGDAPRPRYRPISSYGVVGHLHTVALVGGDGSIDWFCPRRFDAPSLFGEIPDADRGGSFRVAPVAAAAGRQLYLPDTAVLITRFVTEDGVAEVTDLMPVGTGSCAIVRRVEVVRGAVALRARCTPAFDYGRAGHRVTVRDGVARFTTSVGDATELSAGVALTARGPSAEAVFTLGAGDRTWLVLHPVGDADRWDADAVEAALDATRGYWRRWLEGSTYRGRWRETVARSAITLKLLTYEPTGATVAAPTTSLPEHVGGPRNWDYRYTWLRDTAFTVQTLLRLGFHHEADRFLGWLGDRCGEVDGRDPQLRIMYGVDGSREIDERPLEHLEGYAGSGPVRVGNGAHTQLQLDVYGELLDCLHLADSHGDGVDPRLWHGLRPILDWLAANWDRPDEGIWEVRGGRRHFTHSRVMSWVAFDRALRIQARRGLPGDTAVWRGQRARIRKDVMSRGWNPRMGAFTQFLDGDALDAGALLLPLVGFLPPTDPRMLSTLAAIEGRLVTDGLVHRYDPATAADDGLGGAEGAFSLCAFWRVETLTAAGRLDDARLAFERLLGHGNHLGLHAEMVGDRGEALGNFPQAFTHLGLISAALRLDAALG